MAHPQRQQHAATETSSLPTRLHPSGRNSGKLCRVEKSQKVTSSRFNSYSILGFKKNCGNEAQVDSHPGGGERGLRRTVDVGVWS